MATFEQRLTTWFFEGEAEPVAGPHVKAHHTTHWWRVMCLTGVDYFSTLAYQPSIAFLAAGALAPMATLVLIILTLFGALPMYGRIADMSPNGQGSIVILERLFPRWKGKVSPVPPRFRRHGFHHHDHAWRPTRRASVSNPLTPQWLNHLRRSSRSPPPPLLGAIFLRGFGEAISIAVVLVVLYLVSRTSSSLAALFDEIARHRRSFRTEAALFAQPATRRLVAAMAVILFPKLALGSGFETGAPWSCRS